MLNFLFTPECQATETSPTRIVVQRDVVRSNVAELRQVARTLGAGESIAYVIPLDGPPLRRLGSIAMLRIRLRQAEQELARAGVPIVARYGVDPHLDAPACVYELNTPASIYADRYLRPRGRWLAPRRVAAWCFGCDPALGAVVLVARKT